MKKALVKSTKEIFDIEAHFIKTLMSFEISSEMAESLIKSDPQWEKIIKRGGVSDKIERNFYKLSNGIEYESSELIVGTVNIRNWKIENSLEINELK